MAASQYKLYIYGPNGDTYGQVVFQDGDRAGVEPADYTGAMPDEAIKAVLAYAKAHGLEVGDWRMVGDEE